jgi:hypothetical protein
MHLPELAEEAERAQVTLISGRKESRLKLLCDQYSIARYTHNYEDVINDSEVDAVIVATPHPQHVSWGIKAIEAGKHVFMQKPLCADMNEANAFVAAAEKTDRTILCCRIFPTRCIRYGAASKTARLAAFRAHGRAPVTAVPRFTTAKCAKFSMKTKNPAPKRTCGSSMQSRPQRALCSIWAFMPFQHLIALLGTVKSVSAVVNTFRQADHVGRQLPFVDADAKRRLAVAET